MPRKAPGSKRRGRDFASRPRHLLAGNARRSVAGSNGATDDHLIAGISAGHEGLASVTAICRKTQARAHRNAQHATGRSHPGAGPMPTLARYAPPTDSGPRSAAPARLVRTDRYTNPLLSRPTQPKAIGSDPLARHETGPGLLGVRQFWAVVESIGIGLMRSDQRLASHQTDLYSGQVHDEHRGDPRRAISDPTCRMSGLGDPRVAMPHGCGMHNGPGCCRGSHSHGWGSRAALA